MWHRLLGTLLRNRVNGCIQEGHFGSGRAAGCTPYVLFCILGMTVQLCCVGEIMRQACGSRESRRSNSSSFSFDVSYTSREHASHVLKVPPLPLILSHDIPSGQWSFLRKRPESVNSEAVCRSIFITLLILGHPSLDQSG